MAQVYPPSEDSWLLESCILKEDLRKKKCLDMGCGSGVQGAAMIAAGATDVTAADINEDALAAAKEKMQKLGHVWNVALVKSDLFSSIPGSFDFIVFNPPYVPSDGVKWKDLDGGKGGRETIDRFLTQFPSHLNPGGTLFLLVSSLNKEQEVEAILKKKGFLTAVVQWKKLFFETLFVIRAVKSL
jgi:release factor glutamine methyltransferase